MGDVSQVSVYGWCVSSECVWVVCLKCVCEVYVSQVSV